DPSNGGVNDATATQLRFASCQSVQVSSFAQVDQRITLTAQAALPSNGVLSSDAHFTFVFGNGDPYEVVVSKSETDGDNGNLLNPANSSPRDLVDDINRALFAAGVRSLVVAGLDAANRLTFTTTNKGSYLQLNGDVTNSAFTQLKFVKGDSSGAAALIAAAAPVNPVNSRTPYVLETDATFNLGTFDRPDPVSCADRTKTCLVTPVSISVTVKADATNGRQSGSKANSSLTDLIDDLNDALKVAFQAAQIPVEVIAGQESGKLKLQSVKNSLTLLSQFGVFIDPAQPSIFHSSDGGGKWKQEDTGLNRMLGSQGNDKLYGGTGLDFMYGRGGDDQLYRADGNLFETLDGGLAGDAWKQYARQSNKVWYYRSSNANDVITVDYVTEPGLLQNKHLITRSTENNGNFTFDAQVKLSFDATDASGNLIWRASDSQIRLDSLRRENQEAAGTARAERRETQLVNGLLPPEGDFLAIIIDCLDGNDQVTVGPTVQKTVWVDGGAGDDRIIFRSGNAILSDKTEQTARNDFQQDAYSFGQPLLVATTNPAGANNAIVITALDTGISGNGLQVRIIDDKNYSGTSDSAFAVYDASLNQLEIRINDGYTTANTVLASLLSNSALATFRQRYRTARNFGQDARNDGTGLVRPQTLSTA
ncbi:MAG: hypothetical protein ACKOUR_01830, partial [Planctomycetota bacterium]